MRAIRLSLFALGATLTLGACASQPTNAVTSQSPTSQNRLSVGQIRDTVVTNPVMTVSERGGWTNARDKRSFTLWSFTSSEHPAHPAAVKRRIVHRNGVAGIDMLTWCEGGLQACTELRHDFNKRNAGIRQRLTVIKPVRI